MSQRLPHAALAGNVHVMLCVLLEQLDALPESTGPFLAACHERRARGARFS